MQKGADVHIIGNSRLLRYWELDGGSKAEVCGFFFLNRFYF